MKIWRLGLLRNVFPPFSDNFWRFSDLMKKKGFLSKWQFRGMSEGKTFWTVLFFKSNRVFVDIFWLACRLTPFVSFSERNCMMVKNVLDTQNIVLGRQEKFLRRLEAVSWRFFSHSLRVVFRSTLRPWNLASKSKKSNFFLLFLNFVGIDASLDLKIFSSVKVWCWTMFKATRTLF